MPVVHDKEFGDIIVRRSPAATQIRVRVAPDGTLRASLPMRAPMFLVKHLLKSSRDELREILAQSKPVYEYKNGLQVGKSHTLAIQESDDEEFSVTRQKLKIIVKLPPGKQVSNPVISRKIRDSIIAALRIEAKSYLPNRLSFLAQKHGLTYEKVRFSHASGRWGSYSSNGTISLNIALMKLPFELIDYIIIHELSHSKQMNHSKVFWSLVEVADPNYKIHRRELKKHNPSI
ncbi:MAG TPA: SprT family zinc-dependent metalloprotease [Candidatus Saccharimonadales bacterium]|nr:SprT family zinc-dependent metalloprotease [Candidatus Saccharimonadales bacterium]